MGPDPRNKPGNNNIISWDNTEYVADDVRVYDRHEAETLFEKEVNMAQGEIYYVTQGDNSVFNTGDIERSFNSIKEKDESIAKMIEMLADVVHKSGNSEAGELLTAVAVEVESENPKKKLVGLYWTRLKEILPSLKTMTDIATGVEKLIS